MPLPGHCVVHLENADIHNQVLSFFNKKKEKKTNILFYHLHSKLVCVSTTTYLNSAALTIPSLGTILLPVAMVSAVDRNCFPLFLYFLCVLLSQKKFLSSLFSLTWSFLFLFRHTFTHIEIYMGDDPTACMACLHLLSIFFFQRHHNKSLFPLPTTLFFHHNTRL